MNRNEALADEHDAERDREWSAYGRSDLIGHLSVCLGESEQAFLQWLAEQDDVVYELGHGMQESYGPAGFSWRDVTMDELMDSLFRARLRCAMRHATSEAAMRCPNDSRSQHSFTVGWLRGKAKCLYSGRT